MAVAGVVMNLLTLEILSHVISILSIRVILSFNIIDLVA